MLSISDLLVEGFDASCPLRCSRILSRYRDCVPTPSQSYSCNLLAEAIVVLWGLSGSIYPFEDLTRLPFCAVAGCNLSIENTSLLSGC